MNINVVFDASVTNPAAPAPALFQQDVLNVARMIESQFADPITFTIHVGYGEINGTPHVERRARQQPRAGGESVQLH